MNAVNGLHIQTRTLGQDVHRIVNLDIHMVADSLKFLAFCRDDLAIPALDLVRGRALLGEPTSDNNAPAVVFGPVCFLALVLKHHRNFCDADRG